MFPYLDNFFSLKSSTFSKALLIATINISSSISISSLSKLADLSIVIEIILLSPFTLTLTIELSPSNSVECISFCTCQSYHGAVGTTPFQLLMQQCRQDDKHQVNE